MLQDVQAERNNSFKNLDAINEALDDVMVGDVIDDGKSADEGLIDNHDSS
jgi:hypothetical protein